MTERYRVHLFPVVRITLEDIAADSPQQAIHEALQRTDLDAACQQAGHEFTEDVVCYLVDEIANGELRASHWCQDRHHTSTCLLRDLLRVLEAGDLASDDRRSAVRAAHEHVHCLYPADDAL